VKRGWRVFLVLLGCVVVAAVAALMWPKEREPEYQGKKLSEWLELATLEAGHPVDPARLGASPAGEAVRQIGTNGLPYLLKAISYEPSAARERAVTLGAELSPVLRRGLHVDPGAPWSRERRAEAAESGFLVLGPAASPAVLELARLADGTNGAH
jgi:hypothetical protein